MHTCIHAYIHTCIHAYITHACMHIYVYINTCTHLQTFKLICIHTYIHTSYINTYTCPLRAKACAYIHEYMHAYIYTCTYVQTYKLRLPKPHLWRSAHTHTDIQMHTFAHTYILTHIHIHADLQTAFAKAPFLE